MDLLSTSGTIEVFDLLFVLMRVLRVYFLSTPYSTYISKASYVVKP